MINATAIFLGPNLRFGSCTREQNTPIKTTGKMLQDQNMITTGKLVRCIANMEKKVAATTAAAARAEFLCGMITL